MGIDQLTVTPGSQSETLPSRPIAAAVTMIGCFLILVWRRFDQIVNPQFWAEDANFYREALVEGAKTLLQPYAGYLHTGPRLVALLSTCFDPLLAPRIFCTCAAVLTLYVISRVISPRSVLAARYALAVAVVLVPDAYEVLLTIVNIQWLLCLGLLLLALSRDPNSTGQWIHDGAVAVLIGLTGPFSALFLPCFLWRAWQRRTTASCVLAGMVGVCAIIQSYLLLNQDPVGTKPIEYAAILPGIGCRIAGSLLLGVKVQADYTPWIGYSLGIFSVAALVFLGGLKGSWHELRAYAFYAALVLLVGTLYRCRFVLGDIDLPGFGARYFYPIQALMIWLVVVAGLDARRCFKYASSAVLAWMLAMNAGRLREPAFQDMHWSDYAAEIREGKPVLAKVNPAGWEVDFPAAAFRRR